MTSTSTPSVVMSARRSWPSRYPARVKAAWGLRVMASVLVLAWAMFSAMRRAKACWARSYSSWNRGSRWALIWSWLMATWESAETMRSPRWLRSMSDWDSVTVMGSPSGVAAEDEAAAAGADEHVLGAGDLVVRGAAELADPFDDVVHAVDVAL